MKRPAESLLFKLMLVTVVPAISMILIIWLAIDKQAAGYFMALMKKEKQFTPATGIPAKW